MPDVMDKNADLVGKTFRKGGETLYSVTAVDSEFSEVVHWKNLSNEDEGCILADFVRPNLAN